MALGQVLGATQYHRMRLVFSNLNFISFSLALALTYNQVGCDHSSSVLPSSERQGSHAADNELDMPHLWRCYVPGYDLVWDQW